MGWTPGKPSKWHNKVVYVEGKKFASKKEADRFLFLRSEERAGKIRDLRCQVRFRLAPCSAVYVADFVYQAKRMIIDPSPTIVWKEVIEDVKGSAKTETDVFRLKKDMMLNLLGKEIRVVFSATESV